MIDQNLEAAIRSSGHIGQERKQGLHSAHSSNRAWRFGLGFYPCGTGLDSNLTLNDRDLGQDRRIQIDFGARTLERDDKGIA